MQLRGHFSPQRGQAEQTEPQQRRRGRLGDNVRIPAPFFGIGYQDLDAIGGVETRIVGVYIHLVSTLAVHTVLGVEVAEHRLPITDHGDHGIERERTVELHAVKLTRDAGVGIAFRTPIPQSPSVGRAVEHIILGKRFAHLENDVRQLLLQQHEVVVVLPEAVRPLGDGIMEGCPPIIPRPSGINTATVSGGERPRNRERRRQS